MVCYPSVEEFSRQVSIDRLSPEVFQFALYGIEREKGD